jgi:hypothetical protein
MSGTLRDNWRRLVAEHQRRLICPWCKAAACRERLRHACLNVAEAFYPTYDGPWYRPLGRHIARARSGIIAGRRFSCLHERRVIKRVVEVELDGAVGTVDCPVGSRVPALVLSELRRLLAAAMERELTSKNQGAGGGGDDDQGATGDRRARAKPRGGGAGR